jgi:hypothetical protein
LLPTTTVSDFAYAHVRLASRQDMVERRPLIEGIRTPAPPVDPELERQFVHRAKTPAARSPAMSSPSARVPISTRIRAEYAEALKRAPLQRQLDKLEPSTLQDILEEAIEPWPISIGYIR